MGYIIKKSSGGGGGGDATSNNQITQISQVSDGSAAQTCFRDSLNKSVFKDSNEQSSFSDLNDLSVFKDIAGQSVIKRSVTIDASKTIVYAISGASFLTLVGNLQGQLSSLSDSYFISFNYTMTITGQYEGILITNSL